MAASARVQANAGDAGLGRRTWRLRSRWAIPPAIWLKALPLALRSARSRVRASAAVSVPDRNCHLVQDRPVAFIPAGLILLDGLQVALVCLPLIAQRLIVAG